MLKSLMLTAAVGALAVAPFAAHAADMKADAHKEVKSMIAPAATATPAEAAASAATEAAADAETTAKEAVKEVAKEVTLKNGTKVSIEGNSVFVVGADGKKTPAPDATHELADGTKIVTKAGKIVK